MDSSLRQQGILRFIVADFSPCGAKNRQQKDDSYHSAEGEYDQMPAAKRLVIGLDKDLSICYIYINTVILHTNGNNEQQ
jgi:hypothetical protein